MFDLTPFDFCTSCVIFKSSAHTKTLCLQLFPSKIDRKNMGKSLDKLESLVTEEIRHWWAVLLPKQYIGNNYAA